MVKTEDYRSGGFEFEFEFFVSLLSCNVESEWIRQCMNTKTIKIIRNIKMLG